MAEPLWKTVQQLHFFIYLSYYQGIPFPGIFKGEMKTLNYSWQLYL